MGCMRCIFHDPQKWIITGKSYKLKEEYGGEDILEVIYGKFDDDYFNGDLEMYIRKSILDKLMSGEYLVYPRCCITLLIVDRKGNFIEPLEQEFCY